MVSQNLVTTIATLGTLSSFALFASPGIRFHKIFKNKSVGAYSSLPYSVLLVNCAVWICYGTNSSSVAVTVVNSVGALLAAIFIAMYIWFSVEAQRMKAVLGLFGAVMAGSVVAGVGFRAWPTLFGYAGAVTAALMYMSPIEDVKVAFQTKSNKSLSLLMIAAQLINSSLWTAYGSMPFDPFIFYPNMSGILAAGFQLYVYFNYRNAPAGNVEGN